MGKISEEITEEEIEEEEKEAKSRKDLDEEFV